MERENTSEAYEGLSRRNFLVIMGAAAGTAADYDIVAAAAPIEAAMVIDEVKPGEDVFAYIDRVNAGFDQTLYQKVIGSANDFK